MEYPYETCCGWINNLHLIYPTAWNEFRHKMRNPSVVLGNKTTQLNTLCENPWMDSLSYIQTCCDITHIWMQDCLTQPLSFPFLPPICPHLPPSPPTPGKPSLLSFLSVCLSFPPTLTEMKEKNPWHKPVTIIITVIGVIAIVALVTVAVLQNRPLPQKYKV